MMIENNTNYAYQLNHIGRPSFDAVRELSTSFYRELPESLQTELYDALNRGIELLDSEPLMATYLYAFGLMHQAKLEYAFSKLPKGFLRLSEINIIDYGCGQAIGTMCYADYLHHNGYSQQVKVITLIEPSEISLKRAALHASVFFPEAEIKVVNKKFDELCEADIVCSEETPTLHIFSNVLDLMSFDLKKLSACIAEGLKGFNQFICVGPYFNYFGKDNRMTEFMMLLDGKDSLFKTFDKYEFNPNKAWTCEMLLFAKGECSFNVLPSIQSYKDISVFLDEISSNRSDELPKEYQLLKENDTEIIDRIECIKPIVEKLHVNGMLNCEEISIVDYGCGLGIASICFIDWLRKLNYDLGNIKNVKLIDKDENMLEKASMLITTIYPGIKVVTYKEDLLNKEFGIVCDSVLTINLFSNILSEDIRLCDILKRLVLKSHSLFVHNIFIEEISSSYHPDKTKTYYFNYVVNNIKDYTGCVVLANEAIGVKRGFGDDEKTKVFKYALVSRTNCNEIRIPYVRNVFSGLCPGEPQKILVNVPSRMLWFDRPLENTTYCDELDSENKISLEQSSLFEDEYVPDELKPQSIRVCAEKFYQWHIHQALTCGMPCGNEIYNLYEKAAREGITEAYNNLGVLCFLDRYKDEDCEQKGIEYFKRAIESGSDNAMINLASFYMEKGESNLAFSLYKDAAEKGNVVALLNLAISYNFGIDGPGIDIDKAETLYWQCLEEFEKDEEHSDDNNFIQCICCLNLMLLMHKKGEHYLRLLDAFYKVRKPSEELKYCKEVLQIIYTNRYSKGIDKILHLTEFDEYEMPYERYNRALFLYHGLKITSFQVDIKRDIDSALNIIKNLVDTIEDYGWDEKYQYLYSTYARWLNWHKKGQEGQDLVYWKKDAEINPDRACASMTNIAYITKDEDLKKEIWHKYAYSEGCKNCHECGDYNKSLMVCPKAQFTWASTYENQKDEKEALLRQSAEQLYNSALYYFGFSKVVNEQFPTFKDNGIFHVFSGEPEEKYKPLYPILAEDDHYKNLQLAAELKHWASLSLIPFVAEFRDDKYNLTYWDCVFNNTTKCESVKRNIYTFFKEKCNKTIEHYFGAKTLCEKQMISMAEDIAKMTDDVQFICLYANYLLEGQMREQAKEYYLLAKEKGCPDIDIILEEIDRQIQEAERARRQSFDYDEYYDNTDWMRDTWDAMTDGMYGDMPEGFDGDFDFLGY